MGNSPKLPMKKLSPSLPVTAVRKPLRFYQVHEKIRVNLIMWA
jgi:hypothetical protein